MSILTGPVTCNLGTTAIIWQTGAGVTKRTKRHIEDTKAWTLRFVPYLHTSVG